MTRNLRATLTSRPWSSMGEVAHSITLSSSTSVFHQPDLLGVQCLLRDCGGYASVRHLPPASSLAGLLFRAPPGALSSCWGRTRIGFEGQSSQPHLPQSDAFTMCVCLPVSHVMSSQGMCRTVSFRELGFVCEELSKIQSGVMGTTSSSIQRNVAPRIFGFLQLSKLGGQ